MVEVCVGGGWDRERMWLLLFQASVSLGSVIVHHLFEVYSSKAIIVYYRELMAIACNVLGQLRESTKPDTGFHIDTDVILDAIWRIQCPPPKNFQVLKTVTGFLCIFFKCIDVKLG